MSAIAAKLQSLGIDLPTPTAPAANYVPFTVSGKIVYISGQLPMQDGKPQFIGKLGKDVSIEDGQKCAHLKNACGGNLDRVKSCLRMGVFVNSTEEFAEQPKVANGASDFMVEVLGDRGKHARFAVGVAQLPLGVAVEVDATFEIE